MEKQLKILNKRAIVTVLLVFAFTMLNSVSLFAQDDDEIFGTRNPIPKYEDIYDDTSTGIDGYSTYEEEDYYPAAGYADSIQKRYSEDYLETEEYGNSNGYDGEEFYYSSRIRRFHRPVYGYAYYDPWYTNMYWYNNDPYCYGTSIYSGYPSSYWGWNSYSGWNSGWGWSYPRYNSWNPYPFCYSGIGGFGNGYYNSYANGYNNGYYNGLADAGYYNSYDANSGFYYGHRDGNGLTGSGYRSPGFVERYNRQASLGTIAHATGGNQVKNPVRIKPTLQGNMGGATVSKLPVTKPTSKPSVLSSRPSGNIKEPASYRPTKVTDPATTQSKVSGSDRSTVIQLKPQGTAKRPQAAQIRTNSNRTRPEGIQARPSNNPMRPQGTQIIPSNNRPRPQGSQTRPSNAGPTQNMARPVNPNNRNNGIQSRPSNNRPRPQGSQTRPSNTGPAQDMSRPVNPNNRNNGIQSRPSNNRPRPQGIQTRPSKTGPTQNMARPSNPNNRNNGIQSRPSNSRTRRSGTQTRPSNNQRPSGAQTRPSNSRTRPTGVKTRPSNNRPSGSMNRSSSPSRGSSASPRRSSSPSRSPGRSNSSGSSRSRGGR